MSTRDAPLRSNDADDPVDRWFADCPADWRAITLHHLLTHTSGIGHWSDIPDFDVFRPILLAWAAAQSLAARREDGHRESDKPGDGARKEGY